MKYVGLLRGINVGGHRKIRMQDLRQSLTDLGLEQVKTYIQSGNIVFESNISMPQVQKEIQRKIYQDFGFEVPVIIMEAVAFSKGMERNPFKTYIDQSYVVFMPTTPNQADVDDFKKTPIEGVTFEVYENLIFLKIVQPFHQSKFNLNQIEKQLKQPASVRNQKTCNKLLDMLMEE